MDILIVLSICILLLVFPLWGIYCNNTVHTQRTKIINLMYDLDNWELLLDDYKEVSYYKHFGI